MFVHLIISLARIPPANRAMLQKELITENTKLLLKMKSQENLKQYGFVWILPSNVWYKTAALTKSEVQRRFTIFFFHTPFLQGPFTWLVNNKLKWYTNHIYFIFSIIFKSTQLYPVSQYTLRSWWQQPFWKVWDHQCQSGAMTHISRKTKNRRQHAFFLWPSKLMLRIRNLFLHLI